MGALAWVEVLHRDGSVRHAQKVEAWPLRVGRALDNELVLDDPHTAGHHFTIDAGDAGPHVHAPAGDLGVSSAAVGAVVTALPSLNGLHIGSQRLQAGERWTSGPSPFDIVAGRTTLRVRLSGHAVAPELPLSRTRVLHSPWLTTLMFFVLALVAVSLRVCVSVENDELVSELGSTAFFCGLIGLGWGSLWAVLSKLFTHRGYFLWHVRVVSLLAILAVLLDALAGVLAFSLSWAWATDFAFVPLLGLCAMALHFHLQAVEPHRPRLIGALVVTLAVVGVGTLMWRHWQQTGHLGSQPFMSRLMPPSLRLVEPHDTSTFIEQAERLKDRLDRSASGTPDAPDTEAAKDN
ncbi:MAG: hypothetical protein RLZZ618_255 [Pseudomonadota bacterium]|jgi:hypothetical protein